MKKILSILIVVLFFTCTAHQAYGQFFLLFRNPVIGKKAPDIALKDLKGNDKNISSLIEGRNAILFFWAVRCPHCRADLLKLNKEKDKFKADNVALILVNVGENRYIVNKYLSKKKINLNVLFDIDARVPEIYGITGIPTFFYINKDGIVVDSNHNIPDDYMQLLKQSSK